MKRWIVLTLVGLAIVVLLAPGIVGRLAERSIDDSLSRADLESDSIRVESRDFTRGWFTSAGRHRIALNRGPFADFVRGEPGAGQRSPAIVIDTELDHGLLPVTSMRRPQGTLVPGLASAVSTLRFDRGDGELVDFPGTVYSFVELDGDTAMRLLVEPGSDAAGNTRTRWQGADIEYFVSADGRQWSLSAVLESPTTIEAWDLVTTLGSVRVESALDREDHPLGNGRLSIIAEPITIVSPVAEDVVIGPLRLYADNEVDDGVASGRFDVDLRGSGLTDVDELDARMRLVYRGFDADALQGFVTAMREMLRPGDAADPVLVAAAYQRELLRIAQRGAELSITELNVVVPQGEWSLSMELAVASAQSGDPTANLASMLLRSTASINGRLSGPLVEHLVRQDPNFGAAIAAGYIQLVGDAYEVNLELANGVMTINGAPMPLGSFLNQ